MQHTVNTVDENVRGFLPALEIELCDSEDKMKEGIFMDPKLETMKDIGFNETLNENI